MRTYRYRLDFLHLLSVNELNLDPRDAARAEAEYTRRTGGDINHAAAREGPAVINGDND